MFFRLGKPIYDNAVHWQKTLCGVNYVWISICLFLDDESSSLDQVFFEGLAASISLFFVVLHAFQLFCRLPYPRKQNAGVLLKFWIFGLCTMVLFSERLSKITVFLDNCSQKMTKVRPKSVCWRSNQEWRSICVDTVWIPWSFPQGSFEYQNHIR